VAVDVDAASDRLATLENCMLSGLRAIARSSWTLVLSKYVLATHSHAVTDLLPDSDVMSAGQMS
jgi:hypothetical protein